ncbi:MAG: hypothetical protein JWN83_1635 [Chitinophagaceae bacterium]|nr:hypothetical protein [Chitinophagaceae bacterium]
MRNKLFLLCIVICFSVSTKAQTLNQTIIAPAGGSSLTPNYTLDWTMGEFAVETVSTAAKMYTQGFHQPLQIITTTAPVTRTGIGYNISYAPNPVLSILNFSISSVNTINVFVTIADIHGVIFKQYTVSSANGSLQINMNGLPPGTYTLTVRDGVAANIIKTYQIIKG